MPHRRRHPPHQLGGVRHTAEINYSANAAHRKFRIANLERKEQSAKCQVQGARYLEIFAATGSTRNAGSVLKRARARHNKTVRADIDLAIKAEGPLSPARSLAGRVARHSHAAPAPLPCRLPYA